MTKSAKPGSEKALALSKRDQAMEMFKESEAQLKSIYRDGPQNDKDLDSIKACVSFVIAEIYMTQAEEENN